jgi:hypothetical protein
MTLAVFQRAGKCRSRKILFAIAVIATMAFSGRVFCCNTVGYRIPYVNGDAPARSVRSVSSVEDVSGYFRVSVSVPQLSLVYQDDVQLVAVCKFTELVASAKEPTRVPERSVDGVRECRNRVCCH